MTVLLVVGLVGTDMGGNAYREMGVQSGNWKARMASRRTDHWRAL